ncbi:MAG TPA: FecR domain-containing protein [Stellaceae bacterium]|nr:FecR domain-containing protein [Stellaceae bacterium]
MTERRWRLQRNAGMAATVLAVVTAWGGAAFADAQIGAAALVVNKVTGTLASTHEQAALRAGIDVFQNETISTGETSASKVLFQDRTELSVGPMSEVVLDRFVFDPDPTRSQVAVSVAKGVARFSTGLLPKADYELRTPTATIGIRGTLLTITVSANKTSTVSVEEGSAFVSAQGRTVTVGAGYSTLVRPGMPPTPPIASPPLPSIATEMLTLLEQAATGASPVGTRVGSRASAVELPQMGGALMMSPNIDPQKQSEIRGHKKVGDP